MEPRELSRWRKESPLGEDWEEWSEREHKLQEALQDKEPADFLDALAKPSPAIEEPPPDARDVLETYFSGKVSALGNRIAELSDEIERRRMLKEDFSQELDYQISQAALSLEAFRYAGVGYRVGLDIKRNFLERQLADLREKRRRERLRFWEDAVGLRRDPREAVAEYEDLKRRIGMLEGRSK